MSALNKIQMSAFPGRLSGHVLQIRTGERLSLDHQMSTMSRDDGSPRDDFASFKRLHINLAGRLDVVDTYNAAVALASYLVGVENTERAAAGHVLDPILRDASDADEYELDRFPVLTAPRT